MAGIVDPYYALQAILEIPRCPKCGHPVAEHQTCYGAKAAGGHTGTFGCSVCDCQLTEIQKLRAWGGR